MIIHQATFYLETHPGAFLQAYALQRALREAGHQPALVPHQSTEAAPPGWKRRIGCLMTGERATHSAYAAFRARYLTEIQPGSWSEPPGAMVCGSDQIWNPHLIPGNQLDPFFLLQSAPPETRRVSYAASMGGWMPTATEESSFRNSLQGFHAISVREPSAKSLIERLLNREVHLVADPTLLHSSYDELCQTPVEHGDHVLLYGLQWSDLLRQTVTEVARRHRMPITAMGGPLLPWKRIGRRVDPATPGEWIGRIRRAGIVVTNSYHGLIFSILAGKKVYVPLLSASLAKRNERMEHLCAMLGITKQVIVSDATQLPDDEIDWNDVHRRIDGAKRTSLDFLNRALS